MAFNSRWFGRYTVRGEVGTGSSASGLGSMTTGSDGFVNSSAAGEDFIIGADPTIYAWADAPKTDYSLGDTSQGCRVT